jgi:hypothetical protein
MAFTVTNTPVQEKATLAGLGYGTVYDVALDSSNAYPSGGWDVSGLGYPVVGVIQIGNNTAAEGLVAIYNTETGKVQVFWTGASLSAVLAEFSGTFSAGLVLRLLVIGF